MGEEDAMEGSFPDDSVDGLDGREQASMLRVTRPLRRFLLGIDLCAFFNEPDEVRNEAACGNQRRPFEFITRKYRQFVE